MQQFKTLRIISLILVFTLVTFGCATSKNQVGNADFGITAEAVPEGILLTFINFPQDATHLFIQFSSWGDMEVPESQHEVFRAFASLTDASVRGWSNSTEQLDKIRQTNKIIFPFVQAGEKYFITASVYNEHEFISMREKINENPQYRIAHTEFIARNGIYFDRDDVKLELNDTRSVVTLSSEPNFSSEIMFDDQKYSFGVIILLDNGSIGVGDHHFSGGLSPDGLTWAFEPQMTEHLSGDDVSIELLEIGTYHPAFAQAYANIIYDYIRWSVEVAKTSEFDYSL